MELFQFIFVFQRFQEKLHSKSDLTYQPPQGDIKIEEFDLWYDSLTLPIEFSSQFSAKESNNLKKIALTSSDTGLEQLSYYYILEYFFEIGTESLFFWYQNFLSDTFWYSKIRF